MCSDTNIDCHVLESQAGLPKPSAHIHKMWIELQGPSLGRVCGTHKKRVLDHTPFIPVDERETETEEVQLFGGSVKPWASDDSLGFRQSWYPAGWRDTPVESDRDICNRLGISSPDDGEPWEESQSRFTSYPKPSLNMVDGTHVSSFFTEDGQLKPAGTLLLESDMASSKEVESEDPSSFITLRDVSMDNPEGVPPPDIDPLDAHRMALTPSMPVLRYETEEETWQRMSAHASLTVNAEVAEREYVLDHVEKFGQCLCHLNSSARYEHHMLSMSKKRKSTGTPSPLISEGDFTPK